MTKAPPDQASPQVSQAALDECDLIGRWEWNAETDMVRSDPFAALLFNLKPLEAEEGVPLTAYQSAIHADDRERVRGLIRRSVQDGGAYLTEYRVVSPEGQIRWVLTRGRFQSDQDGRPIGGSGILIDITRLRMAESTSTEYGSQDLETSLDHAVEHVLAARSVIVELRDPSLTACADALLMSLGRKLAQQEVRQRRERLN